MIRQGNRFLHSRYITRDREPEVCEVTRVASTSIYFRVGERGAKRVADRSSLDGFII